MEDDLPATERPTTRDREELAHVLERQTFEQRPLHLPASLCNGGDIRNVADANDTARGDS